MEDFDALASSLAVSLGVVRGCLILSRDGLVLGSSPSDTEASTRYAWVRFAALGDPERGFVQFDAVSWCYVRRGSYAAFAVAGPGARPGLVLDQMDQALLAAEEARTRHEGLGTRASEPTSLPTSSPGSRPYPKPSHGREPVEIDAPQNRSGYADPKQDLPPKPGRDLGLAATPQTPRAGAASAVETDGWVSSLDPKPIEPVTEPPAGRPERAVPRSDLDATGVQDSKSELAPIPEHGLNLVIPPAKHEPSDTPETPPWGRGEASEEPDDEEGVDRFSLAREFGQLLQRGEDPADG